MDSNHRRFTQQIYSLPHLAALEHPLNFDPNSKKNQQINC
ncbi:MAG: hypothetical protein RL757_744 [Bacteroidota bacterium]